MVSVVAESPFPRTVSTSRQPIVQGRHLTQIFSDGNESVAALNDVSIECLPGEVALILGPAGSGKSTLLAVLSGLLRPTSGDVVALGLNLWALPEKDRDEFRLRHCGFVFQEYHLLPSLTARQQMELMLRWGSGVAAEEARLRVDKMLQSLDLARKGDLMPWQLSGGEQQRVAIGRGLIKHPELCFADEPTAALDWTHGKQVIALLAHAAHDLGASVIITTHDERIIEFADRVFLLDDGRLRIKPDAHPVQPMPATA